LYSELVSYFDNWIAEVDDAVAVISSGSKPKKEVKEHHMRFVREMREKTDPLLKKLSDSFGLTQETVNPLS